MSTFNTGITTDLSIGRLGKPNGFASLTAAGKIPDAQIPGPAAQIPSVLDYLKVNSVDAAASATGEDALAIGEGASAVGDDSVAIGVGALTQSANGGVAIGASAISRSNGVAIGKLATISNTSNSIAIGFQADATTSFSIAIGSQTTSTGDRSVAFGWNSRSLGESSVALGRGTYVTADQGIAIGKDADVFSTAGVQIGTGVNYEASTLQFLTNKLANAEGLYTAHSAVNYVPADADNVTAHFAAIDTTLGTFNAALDELAEDVKLTSDITYYVDVVNGNDSNDGLSPGVGNAWRTAQFALDYIEKLDCNNFTPTIEFANGDYTGEGALHLPPIRNPKTITCGGGGSAPNSHLILQAATANQARFRGFEADQPGYYGLYRLRLESVDSTTPCIKSNRGAIIELTDSNVHGLNGANPDGIAFFASDLGRIILGGYINIEDKIQEIFKVIRGGSITSEAISGANITIGPTNTGFNYTVFNAYQGTIDLANGGPTLHSSLNASSILSGTQLNGGHITVTDGDLFDTLINTIGIHNKGTINGYRIGWVYNSIRRLNINTNITLDAFGPMYHHLECNTPSLTVNLHPDSLRGAKYIVKNNKNSTESFTINNVSLSPGEVYEIIYDGVEWVVL